ncbi:MAG: VIT and VWA domain-containing protein [Thermodesulfobacteriota bacterium]|nr:VIT and VWA domain-containing protein [Thermodesulfobacteriota bacterium]
MKRAKLRITGMLLTCLLIVTGTGSALAAGLLSPGGGNLPALEIKDHRVKVVIEDGYAVTIVDQVFHNPHATDLEAIYSFPVPEKAAVSEFTMWIDNMPIHGEVLEKAEARQVYEQQKAAGQEAGLTEKDGYKTFEITVSPVRAGQDTRIRLGYIQPARVDSSVGHYVYPLEEGGVDEAKLAFWTANEKVTGDFSFDLILRSAYPVDGVRLPNHPNATIVQNGDDYHVHLGNNPVPGLISGQDQPAQPGGQISAEQESAFQSTGPVFSLDQDIVVYYRHADNLPGSVDLVTYKPEEGKRGTFMLTVTPAMDLKPITEGRDWVFVLDISGSMQGKYHTLAEGVSQAMEKMSPNERFRIVLFNNSASELTRGYTAASPENVREYITKVKQISAGGSTNVYDGLKMGLNKLDSDRTSAILLVTDGVANVGVTQQHKFIELIRKHDVRLFTFIMGNSANRPLLTAVTDASNGFAMNVSNSDDIVGSILLAKSKVTHEALHGAKVKIKGIKTFDFTPEKIGSLYRGQQLIIFGHYYGSGEAKVSLSGKISGEEKLYQASFNFPDKTIENPEVERLWAYATIEQLSREMDYFGEDADSKEAITDLGVEYGLVTDYTSMIVVREEVFKQLGIERRNQSRLQQEFTAREQRAQSVVTSRRVDSAQPMFNHNRPTTRSSGGGSGAFDLWALLLLVPLAYIGRRKERST